MEGCTLQAARRLDELSLQARAKGRHHAPKIRRITNDFFARIEQPSRRQNS